VRGPAPKEIAYVFQENTLFPWNTILDNIKVALEFQGVPAAERQDRAKQAIEAVGLSEFAHSYPHQLSGGMKQRASLARALSMQTDILLMDEPFAALDALTRRKMQDELLQLWDDTHFTVLFVTHSIPEAVKIGSRILLLSPHPGQVKAELNSLPRGAADPEPALALERRIHDLLFADAVENEEESHA
jgi:NitT/TauT family transport system ATP-binding protein